MIVTFSHYKGGTGKTTSCISVAGHLAKMGYGVLVVDLDPQGNASSGLGIDVKSLRGSMYDVMVGKKRIMDIVIESSVENLHLG